MILLESIRVRLAESISKSGMTQTAIAHKLHVSQQAVSCYVTGKKLPALDTFANLCTLLDVDPAYILCMKVE